MTRRAFSLATFEFDVTPPLGHSLCGGLIKSAVAVGDPLKALGLVLLGSGSPIVLCAVDWAGLANEAHARWRQALADAAGTSPDRVAVQCVHQHDAPLACVETERLVAQYEELPRVIDSHFFAGCLDRGKHAVRAAIPKARSLTHVAGGKGKVAGVASNRRVLLDDRGRVGAMRGSRCIDPALRALPEGTVDPWLRTVGFFERDAMLAACHYYATHPMSYFGEGVVSSDFVGLARQQRQAGSPNCLHIYFTGCAGDTAAGKYNDGSREMRPVLQQRIYEGIVASEDSLQPLALSDVEWRTQELLPSPNKGSSMRKVAKALADRRNARVDRSLRAHQLAFIRRLERRAPVVTSALLLNDVAVLNLPAECFVEYQLRAQRLRADRFVATAAYGDGGPWYIPTESEYARGGYEVELAFCDPVIDEQLMDAMRALLA